MKKASRAITLVILVLCALSLVLLASSSPSPKMKRTMETIGRALISSGMGSLR
jgi:hypothetical protein